MRKNQKNDLKRILAAAILQAAKDEYELETFIALLREPEIYLDVAMLLTPWTGASEMQPPKAEPITSRAGNPMTSIALAEMQRQKINKGQLTELVNSINPGIWLSVAKKQSVSEILDTFFRLSSPTQSSHLLEQLGFTRSGDPYLKGITRPRS